MMSKITGIQTVAIPVTDQDKAIEFYRDRLGMEISLDETIEQIDTRWVEMWAPGSAASIALIPAGEGRFEAGRDTGLRHTTADASALHAELTEAGIEVGELLKWGDIPPMFHMVDLDGNTLYILE
jgi:lactoylglutathione lyase